MSEFINEERLSHVLDATRLSLDITNISMTIKAMREDIYREAGIEAIQSKANDNAIGKHTAIMFKRRVNAYNRLS